jgi:crossover junction endodeoxyribonuclease RuvC
MRVIGVDPGTLKLGWGVIEKEGTRVRHIAHGVVKMRGELCDRLVHLEKKLSEVVVEYAPTAGAIESIFFSKNAQSAAKLGHARGVIMVCLRRAGLDIGEYPPALVKRAVTGSGRADKNQVQRIVKALLALPELPPEDAADALAVAFTHLNTVRFADAVRSRANS